MIKESEDMPPFLKVDIPESIIPTYEEFVVEQFKKANITISQGAKMLGISYNDFMVFLGKQGISFSQTAKKDIEHSEKTLDKYFAGKDQ
jgi:predicted HTH domain antitoxin